MEIITTILYSISLISFFLIIGFAIVFYAENGTRDFAPTMESFLENRFASLSAVVFFVAFFILIFISSFETVLITKKLRQRIHSFDPKSSIIEVDGIEMDSLFLKDIKSFYINGRGNTRSMNRSLSYNVKICQSQDCFSFILHPSRYQPNTFYIEIPNEGDLILGIMKTNKISILLEEEYDLKASPAEK